MADDKHISNKNVWYHLLQSCNLFHHDAITIPSRFDLQHLLCKVFGYLLIRRTCIQKILSLLIKDMKRKLCWGILCLNSNKPMLWFNSTALEKIYIRKDCGLGFLWVKLSETFSLRILIKIDFSYSIIN